MTDDDVTALAQWLWGSPTTNHYDLKWGQAVDIARDIVSGKAPLPPSLTGGFDPDRAVLLLEELGYIVGHPEGGHDAGKVPHDE